LQFPAGADFLNDLDPRLRKKLLRSATGRSTVAMVVPIDFLHDDASVLIYAVWLYDRSRQKRSGTEGDPFLLSNNSSSQWIPHQVRNEIGEKKSYPEK